MQKANQVFLLLFFTVVTACGKDDNSLSTGTPRGGELQSVKQIYEAMEPLCGPVAMAIGLTSNETALDNFGPTLWVPPETKLAPFVGYYSNNQWPTELLKSAQLGGPYNYFKLQILANSEQAASLCESVRKLIFPGEYSVTRQVFSNILFYLSGFDTPLPPWNGEVGNEVFNANIEMILSYSSAEKKVDSNNNVSWLNPDFQYLSMKVECDQPFQVEQVIKTFPLDSLDGGDATFCAFGASYKTCLGLKGVYSGNQCTYVVENQHFIPVDSTQALTVSFGGTITLAPEPDFAARPAYRMTVDRFKY